MIDTTCCSQSQDRRHAIDASSNRIVILMRCVLGCVVLFALTRPSEAETYTVISHKVKPVGGWAGRLVEVEFKSEMKAEVDPFAKLLKQQPGLQHQVQMTRRQVQWTFGGDLSFAARICKASDEQKKQMKKLARAEYKKMLTKAAKEMERQFMGGRVQQRKLEDPAKARRNATERVVRAAIWPELMPLPKDPLPDRLEEWRTESKAREEFRNRTNATVLINVLGDRLLLSQEQHGKIVDAVTSVWDSKWDYYVQLIVHNPQFFPRFPDRCLEPHLSEEQFGYWKTMSKQEIHGSGWQNMHSLFLDQNAQNEWFDDVPKAKIVPNGALLMPIGGND